MSTKPYLGPITREMGPDKSDPSYHAHQKESPVYYTYLYRNRKPVYRLTCCYRNMLEDAVKTFLEDDSTLEHLLPIKYNKFKDPSPYEDVSVDFLEN